MAVPMSIDGSHLLDHVSRNRFVVGTAYIGKLPLTETKLKNGPENTLGGS